jgi:hypothetical protein
MADGTGTDPRPRSQAVPNLAFRRRGQAAVPRIAQYWVRESEDVLVVINNMNTEHRAAATGHVSCWVALLRPPLLD